MKKIDGLMAGEIIEVVLEKIKDLEEVCRVSRVVLDPACEINQGFAMLLRARFGKIDQELKNIKLMLSYVAFRVTKGETS